MTPRTDARPRRCAPRALRIAVVGAGMAGLSAARTLADHGHSVVVFDKGRGPGGRASHRRREGFVFDHGAQYVTARDPRIRRLIDTWFKSDVVASWHGRIVALGSAVESDAPGSGVGPERRVDPDRPLAPDRLVGVPGMNAIAVHLSRDLDVRCGVQINEIRDAGPDAGWLLADASDTDPGRFDVALVAVPPAQAVPLLDAAPALARRAAGVRMRPCWAVLLGFEDRVPLAFDGAFVNTDGPLSWIARNSSKPGRTGGEAWVLHAGPGWSERQIDLDPASVIVRLREAFHDLCVAAETVGESGFPRLVHAEAHRWRFATPDPPLDEPCLFDPVRAIGAGGDWCGGPRIEGALLSGLALAERVLARAQEGPDQHPDQHPDDDHDGAAP